MNFLHFFLSAKNGITYAKDDVTICLKHYHSSVMPALLFTGSEITS